VQLSIRFRKQDVIPTHQCIKTESVRVSLLYFGRHFPGTVEPFTWPTRFAGYTTLNFFLWWSMLCHCLKLCRTRTVLATVRYIRHTYDVWTESDSSLCPPHEGVHREQGCSAVHSLIFVLDRTWRSGCFTHGEEPKYTLNRSWVVLWDCPDDLEKTKSLVPAGIRTADRPAGILVATPTALRGLFYRTHLTIVGSLTVPSRNYLLTSSMEQSTSWEVNRFSFSQDIPRILCNQKVH